LIKNIKKDLMALKKIFKVDFKSLTIYMDWIFYYMTQDIETSKKKKPLTFENAYDRINRCVSKVMKNKKKLYQQYVKTL
jgi:hypothetical protein